MSERPPCPETPEGWAARREQSFQRTLDLVWAPWYSAYRFPDRQDRWFPPLLEVPDRVATPLGPVPVDTRYADVDAPPHTLASSDVGAF